MFCTTFCLTSKYRKENNIREHLLVTIAKSRFNNAKCECVSFLPDLHANNLLNDLENYPHAFVLACCMDRQVRAERAWMIPWRIYGILRDFSIKSLSQISLEEYKILFMDNNLHRLNKNMAEVFYSAVHRIIDEYDGDASRIWNGVPSSATVVYRFLEFEGVGIKISTMATNILARQFRISLSAYYSIDVSPDVHVKRVMRRMGLVSQETKDDEVDKFIYKARELNPEFPGIIDFSLWEVGRTWCKATNPNCDNCIVSNECHKKVE